MPFEFRLPDIGEGVVEGEIIKWYVKPGQKVKEDDPLVEVMTDKATVMIPSPRKGTILETRGDEGAVVKVGAVLVTLDTGDGASTAAAPTTETPAPAKQPQQTQKATAKTESSARALATPAIRKLAQDMEIDINQVNGTGPGGRVTKEDLEKLKSVPPAARRPSSEDAGKQPLQMPLEHIPFRGLRKKVAEKMVQSKQKAPHYTYVDEIDMTEMVKLRTAVNNMSAEKGGTKVTYLPFIIKALIPGLKKYPLLNAVLDEEHGRITLKHHYNVGIGVATPDGLTVVVVKNADQKSITDVAKEIERLSEQARQNKVALDDLRDGTFTITSLGNLGGMFATPIINYPEVAIVGIHKIEQRPVVRNEQIVIRDMMYMSLSFDHRVVDGAVGAEFCSYVKQYLENPALLFMNL
jgi:pyruvate dehydrogenase E2 component (dihydrolipoyllysine-residue acetyltransferase)